MNSSSKRPEDQALETLRGLGWPIPEELYISNAPDGSNLTRTTCFILTRDEPKQSKYVLTNLF